ncbi:uncharacterized protein RSE6_13272 [Rhynchosporium secalis]|uniref:Uncharacterized protein n=1 Tax=Rhynchosporium secalis TaxID=38038 RepID=A0A1E1MSG3_RHYSE|nr:uncharacterized protein RSE6_13272 [Rhynchosporium secalis]
MEPEIEVEMDIGSGICTKDIKKPPRKKLIVVITSEKLKKLNPEPRAEVGIEAEIDAEKIDIGSKIGVKDGERPAVKRERKKMILVIRSDKLKTLFLPQPKFEHGLEVEGRDMVLGMKDIDQGLQEENAYIDEGTIHDLFMGNGELQTDLEQSETSDSISTINGKKRKFFEDPETEAIIPTASEYMSTVTSSEDDSDTKSLIYKKRKFMLKFKLDPNTLKRFNFYPENVGFSSTLSSNSSDDGNVDTTTQPHSLSPSPKVARTPTPPPQTQAQTYPQSLLITSVPEASTNLDAEFCFLCKSTHSSPCPLNPFPEYTTLTRAPVVFPTNDSSNNNIDIRSPFSRNLVAQTPTISSGLNVQPLAYRPLQPPTSTIPTNPRMQKCLTCEGIHSGTCVSNAIRLDEIEENLSLFDTLTRIGQVIIQEVQSHLAAHALASASSSPDTSDEDREIIAEAASIQAEKDIEVLIKLGEMFMDWDANSRPLLLEEAMREGDMEEVECVRSEIKKARDKDQEQIVSRADAERWFDDLKEFLSGGGRGK